MLLGGNEREEGGRKVERCPTTDEDPHRGDIPSLNLAPELCVLRVQIDRVPRRDEVPRSYAVIQSAASCPFSNEPTHVYANREANRFHLTRGKTRRTFQRAG